MAIITAKDGKVFKDTVEIADVITASIEETADNKTYVDSSTGGWSDSAEGARRWTGSVTIGLPDGAAIASLSAGTKYAWIFRKTSTNNDLSGDARIDRIGGPEIDIGGSGLLQVTVEVSGCGALVRT